MLVVGDKGWSRAPPHQSQNDLGRPRSSFAATLEQLVRERSLPVARNGLRKSIATCASGEPGPNGPSTSSPRGGPAA
jgi:hypothetical protein